MRTLLKILISGLLLVLMVAVGAEVVALHRAAVAPGALAAPVIVRKAPDLLPPPKLVRALPNAPRRRMAQVR